VEYLSNQITRDLKTAAELTFSGAIVTLEAIVLFGLFYLLTH